ncbi:L,D-transpeptidase [Amycolatopsis granulosa]|uniref:L,D-transpeptidase n=1 Tax=Amycolatopsis granulosa TaxID=185684 RepID=UPI00312C8857|nr:lipoprotein-anchoring transpeptidase ErfK/SrfK [Amycolatopsis granulosa]
MTVKKIMLAVSAAAAVLVLAACGSASEQAAGLQQVAATASTTTTTPPSSTSSAPASSSSRATPSSSPSRSSSPTSTPKKPAPTQEAQAAGVPCAATVDACVDLSARKAWLLHDGQIVYGPVQIMPGMASHPTPVGTFRVSSKVKDYHSREFDAPMPNSVFFQPGVAFHQGSLSRYSHGCIHLSTSASEKFFSSLSSGDTVQVVR